MFWEREREDRHSEQMQAVQTQTFLFPTLPPTHIPPKVPLYSPSPLLLLLWEVKAHLPTKGLWGHASACEMWTRWHSRAALSRAVLLFTRVPVSGLTSWTKVYVSAEGKMGREVCCRCTLQLCQKQQESYGCWNGRINSLIPGNLLKHCYHELEVTAEDISLAMLKLCFLETDTGLRQVLVSELIVFR